MNLISDVLGFSAGLVCSVSQALLSPGYGRNGFGPVGRGFVIACLTLSEREVHNPSHDFRREERDCKAEGIRERSEVVVPVVFGRPLVVKLENASDRGEARQRGPLLHQLLTLS
jgi:hypothetical protein